MYRTKCSCSEGCTEPAPTVTVTSNHCPRFTESGASILGVCFSSYDRRTSRNSGVNCSACPSAPTRAVVGTRASTARTTTTPDVFPYLIAFSPPSVLGQQLADQRQQVPRAVRLGQVRRGASVHGTPVVAAQRERRHDHERNMRRAGIGPEPAGGVEPRQLRQLDIHEDEVGQLALRHGDPLLAIRRLQQPVGRPAQQLPDDLPVVLVVLDVEHRPLVHPRPPSACRGTVKKKVDPLPSSLSTQMRPPCSSTSRFVILSPSPVPPYSRVIAASTWRNSAKTFSTSSLGMPIPVSVTRYTSHSPSSRASMSTLPCRVNLSALPARFMRHCVMRRPSPRAGGMSGDTVAVNVSCFPRARDRREAWTTSTISCTEYSPPPSSSRPASIFDRSSTSLMSRSRWRPFVWISVSGSRRPAGTSPYRSSRMSSVKPRIALSGVRSSWLIFARNSDLARLACDKRSLRPRSASAATRCSSSSRRSSRLVQFIRSASAPNSSRFGTTIVPPNRPSATSLRKLCTARTGRMNDHEITKPPSSARVMETAAKPAISRSERRLAASMPPRKLAIRVSSTATSWLTSPSIRR